MGGVPWGAFYIHTGKIIWGVCLIYLTWGGVLCSDFGKLADYLCSLGRTSAQMGPVSILGGGVKGALGLENTCFSS